MRDCGNIVHKCSKDEDIARDKCTHVNQPNTVLEFNAKKW